MAQPLCKYEDLFKESHLSSQEAWVSVDILKDRDSNILILENYKSDDDGGGDSKQLYNAACIIPSISPT